MRGMSTGGGGSVVNTILKFAPIACAFFAFLFMSIALSSAVKPNYIEGLHVISFNTSTLGKNLIKVPDVQAAAKDGCDSAGNGVSQVTNKIGDGVGAIGNAFGGGGQANDAIDKAGDAAGGATTAACNKGAEIANQAVQLTKDVIDKALGSIAKAIGIKEYYSVHIGALCQGNYKPLFSDKDAKPDVESCSPKFKTEKTDLSKALDDELQVGPFKFKLSDLDLVEGIQKAFDLIPRALAAMAFFFLFATVALVLGLVLSVLTVAFEYKLQKLQKPALLGSLGAMGFGWLTLLIGVIGLTAVAEKIKKSVNDQGETFGMTASTSPGLYFLLWASLLLSTAAFAMLFFVWFRNRGEKNRPSDGSGVDAHGFATMPTTGAGPDEFRNEKL